MGAPKQEKCIISRSMALVADKAKTVDEIAEELKQEFNANPVFLVVSVIYTGDEQFMGATESFEDAVGLYADCVINSHDDGVESWERKYEEIRETCKNPPTSDSPLLVYKPGPGFGLVEEYIIRIGTIDEVITKIRTYVEHKARESQEMGSRMNRASYSDGNMYGF